MLNEIKQSIVNANQTVADAESVYIYNNSHFNSPIYFDENDEYDDDYIMAFKLPSGEEKRFLIDMYP